MALIKCKECGFENPEGNTVCDLCGAELGISVAPDFVPTAEQTSKETPPMPSDALTGQDEADDGLEYFVKCGEGSAETIVPNKNITSFFCVGCKKQHEIDGFMWTVESRPKKGSLEETSTLAAAPAPAAMPSGDRLWLEEAASHMRIDIDKSGGTLGRYGKYGSEFFQSRGLLTVSGEHCKISNVYGDWVIEHVSHTNQTVYDGSVLKANEPRLLEDGKVLTLANAVSFIVRIG